MSSEIREAIDKLGRDWETYWNRHDMRTLATLVSEDVDFVNVRGVWLRGRSEFEQFHTRAHQIPLWIKCVDHEED